MIMGLISGIAVALLLFVSRASAQQQMGSMMSGCMMGWPMMLFMGVFWLLLLILMALAILWLIKQLRK
jgi:uncharacterized membrane protein